MKLHQTILFALLALTLPASAGEVVKDNNNVTLKDGPSWVGGAVPGSGDVAVWNSVFASTATGPTLGASPLWGGLRIADPGLATSPQIRAFGVANFLTLGSAGIDMSLAPGNFSKDFLIGPKVALGTAQSWTIAAGRVLTLSYGLDGAGITVTKAGAGTLKLTGAVTATTTPTFTANIDIADGTLQSSPAAGTQTLAGTLAGSGTLLKDGAGALTLANSNAGFGGTLNLTAGQLNLNHADALGGGTLNLTGGALDNTSGAPLTLSGNGPQHWNGSFSFVGSASLNLGLTAITLANNPTVTVGANTLTLASPLTSPGSFAKAGAGTLELNSTGSVIGQFGINGGSVKLAGGDFQCSAMSFGGTGTAEFQLNGGTLITGQISRTGGVANFNFNGGTLKAAAGGAAFLTGLSAATVGAGGARINPNGNSITIAQPLLHDPALGGAPDGGLVLTGGGTLTLTGAATYTGPTLVTDGTLALGTGGSLAASPLIELADTGNFDGGTTGITLPAGQTLTGTGTLAGKITVGAGAILDPGGGGIGTLGGSPDLILAGTADFQINKLGSNLSYDAVTANSVKYGGTLTVTATGTPLVAGDFFKLFDAGTYSGSFTTLNLPGLPSGNFWDTSTLLIDGTLTIVNVVPAPAFNPPAGSYFGAQSVTLTSIIGSTIHYTTDGSNPAISGTVISAPSPVAGVLVPNDSVGFTINAYASVPGSAPSAGASAVYNTLSAAVWILNGSGSWSEPTSWRYDLVASGAGVTANFNTLTLSADATVTLDGPRTIGNLKFGDLGNAFKWTLGGSTLTLDGGGGIPVITVTNQTATISSLAAAAGLVKDGAGILSLVGSTMTYGGPTTLNAGVLELKNNGNLSGGGFRSPITTGASTAVWLTADGGQTSDLRANIAGNASVVKKGPGIVRVGTFSGVPVLNYSGPTTVETGNLNLQGQAAGRGFDTTGPLIVNSGALFDFGGIAAQSAANAARFGALVGTGTISGAYGSAFLECGNGGGSGTFEGPITNTGGSTSLIKSGSGTQTLTGASTYNGTTTVAGGALLVNNTTGSGTGSSAVTVNATGTLGGKGAIAGTVVVATDGLIAPGITGTGTLTIGAATLAGTYQCQLDGANCDKLAVGGGLDLTGSTLAVTTLAGGATQSSYIIATYTGGRTGTFATVTGLPAGYTVDYTTANQIKLVGAAGFASWIAGYGLTGANALPGADPDKDGIANAVEFVLGGNPATVMDAALLPTIALVTNPGGTVPNGTYLKFTYRRTPASAYLNPGIEYGADLTGVWTSAAGAPQVVAPGFYTTPTAADKVEVYVSRTGNQANGKLFGRLRVSVP